MIASRLLLLGLAGALGTVARHGINVGIVARAGHPAASTFVVNVTGCLLLGIAWGALHGRDLMDSDVRLLLFTGFLGAFTTFSALMFDTARLARDVSPVMAAANIGAQVVVGLLLLAGGLLVGRAL